MTKTQKITYYTLIVIMSILFLLSSIAKLLDNQVVAQSFIVANLPIWFMYLIGVAEVLGAVGLWIKKLRFGATVVLAILVCLSFPFSMILNLGNTILPLWAVAVGYILVYSKKETFKTPPSPQIQ